LTNFCFSGGKYQDICLISMTFILCITKAFFDCGNDRTWQILFKIVIAVIIRAVYWLICQRTITNFYGKTTTLNIKNRRRHVTLELIIITTKVFAKTLSIEGCRGNNDF